MQTFHPIVAIIYFWHRSNSPSPPLINPPKYGSNESGTDDDLWDDYLTDPSKSYLPGNIYHQDDDYFLNTSSNDLISTFTDDMLDPSKDYLPYNIYHHDDD